jgi:hypothetical protein
MFYFILEGYRRQRKKCAWRVCLAVPISHSSEIPKPPCRTRTHTPLPRQRTASQPSLRLRLRLHSAPGSSGAHIGGLRAEGADVDGRKAVFVDVDAGAVEPELAGFAGVC